MTKEFSHLFTFFSFHFYNQFIFLHFFCFWFFWLKMTLVLREQEKCSYLKPLITVICRRGLLLLIFLRQISEGFVKSYLVPKPVFICSKSQQNNLFHLFQYIIQVMKQWMLVIFVRVLFACLNVGIRVRTKFFLVRLKFLPLLKNSFQDELFR